MEGEVFITSNKKPDLKIFLLDFFSSLIPDFD